VPAGFASRLWRRYLRLSLQGLIVLVLVIGAGLGWIVRSARIQREAVAAIERAHGWVAYDFECLNRDGMAEGKRWMPRWLEDLIGVDYFSHVTAVWLWRSRTATDATFAQVERLTQVQQLELAQSSISDADLAHLKGLTSLSQLGLSGTRVTDAGLAHLKGLTNLSLLYLGGTQVTDAGMRDLKQALPTLTIIR